MFSYRRGCLLWYSNGVTPIDGVNEREARETLADALQPEAVPRYAEEGEKGEVRGLEGILKSWRTFRCRFLDTGKTC
jgi:hypothetical protein